MGSPSFRDKIKSYVDDHWMVPAEDGFVWVYYDGINAKAQVAQQKAVTKKDWAAVFLRYADPTYGSLEGLYLIPASDLAKVKAGQFDATQYPARKMISSWFDKDDKNNQNAEVTAQKPPYNGLNDCAHFVTQSLAAGGVHVETRGVTELYNLLTGLSDTKTLAKMVSKDMAERIINADVMKVGDVIIYTKDKEFHHSVVYMGSGKIAMHTWANHPDHPTLKGDWKASATTDHPDVTLIHFGRDDALIPVDSGMLGWWQVVWRGTNFYYYFEKSGRVSWVQHKPPNFTQPMLSPFAKGYWFPDSKQVTICWTDSGSLETLAVKPPQAATHMEGMTNGVDRIVADKVS